MNIRILEPREKGVIQEVGDIEKAAGEVTYPCRLRTYPGNCSTHARFNDKDAVLRRTNQIVEKLKTHTELRLVPL